MTHVPQHDALYERWMDGTLAADAPEWERIAEECPHCKARVAGLQAIEARIAAASRLRTRVLAESEHAGPAPGAAAVRSALEHGFEEQQGRRARPGRGLRWALAVAAVVLLAFGVRWMLDRKPTDVVLGEHDVQLVAPLTGEPWDGTFTWDRAAREGEELDVVVQGWDDGSSTWKELRRKRTLASSWTVSDEEHAAWSTLRIRWKVDVLDAGGSLLYPTEFAEPSRSPR